jgi:hypothetical protein
MDTEDGISAISVEINASQIQLTDETRETVAKVYALINYSNSSASGS